MKKLILFTTIAFFTGIAIGYAAAPLLVCYMSGNACVNVSIANPLPAQSD